ncbi:hypothetical protein LOC68_08580 [Blastopirellula sp. JC732]|uniref:HEPN domain-containing protein n=1 Tax=Blastopirellula sediminis TaxID=2894196 RepID=A0A9X1MKL0_9BACT|nr:hypothetical protein [Blastopirellula sediminis]MCC9608774.1 hypothetical protein [Blastopirellula sediminis]MCC9628449.1 hypothetical protein [Blastopirellula sediminis]
MKTKAYVKYLNRTAQFDADLELADAFSQPSHWKHQRSKIYLFDGIAKHKHPRLAKRKRSDHNRALACKHLNTTLRGAYIKDVYEELSHFLVEIIRCCAKKSLDPNRLIGDHRFAIEANKLLQLGSWDAVVQQIANDLFRKLENERSTIKLIEAIDAKLNLQLDVAVVESALPYLDMRHILVHQNGVVDAEYAARHPQVGLKEGEAFSLSYSQISEARLAINALVKQIDGKVVTNALVLNEDTQP